MNILPPTTPLDPLEGVRPCSSPAASHPHFFLSLMLRCDLPVTFYFQPMAMHLDFFLSFLFLFFFFFLIQKIEPRIVIIEYILTDRLKSKFSF